MRNLFLRPFSQSQYVHFQFFIDLPHSPVGCNWFPRFLRF